MPNLRPGEIILILLVVLLLFGAKRMPDLARSLGRSLRIFKTETKALRDEDEDEPTVKTGTVIQEPTREINAAGPPPQAPQAAETPKVAEPERSER